jgi:hypothetical protein
VFENVANGGADFGGKTQFGDTYQQRRQVMSLTGKPMDAAEFKHNNMAPFFGAKIRGRTADADVQESVLDTMNGAGSAGSELQPTDTASAIEHVTTVSPPHVVARTSVNAAGVGDFV